MVTTIATNRLRWPPRRKRLHTAAYLIGGQEARKGDGGATGTQASGREGRLMPMCATILGSSCSGCFLLMPFGCSAVGWAHSYVYRNLGREGKAMKEGVMTMFSAKEYKKNMRSQHFQHSGPSCTDTRDKPPATAEPPLRRRPHQTDSLLCA